MKIKRVRELEGNWKVVTSHNLPSSTEVGFRENQRLFGEDCYTNDPENTVNNLKPLLGAKLSALGSPFLPPFFSSFPLFS